MERTDLLTPGHQAGPQPLLALAAASLPHYRGGPAPFLLGACAVGAGVLLGPLGPGEVGNLSCGRGSA